MAYSSLKPVDGIFIYGTAVIENSWPSLWIAFKIVPRALNVK